MHLRIDNSGRSVIFAFDLIPRTVLMTKHAIYQIKENIFLYSLIEVSLQANSI